ncbi:DNA-binding MarR family transcriptional regulator [Archangium gephyra]|uniref:DNA-binding MarR family transcriptional regulator n=1 Tax=Archangium gephyra TaxID=48 RepID=A0AAC8QAV8_9BACT|nr:MarR family transcriptional regulator [Archangium gephyra]AKJ04282.1 Transcriptional regulator, MarR family [Archangium gephyra]REG37638.1 DNA-binding MarR family transcriptional regulator [Archangium gephyra]
MTLAEQIGTLRRTLYRLLARRLSGKTRRPLTQLLAVKYVAARGVRTQAELAERLLVDAPAVSRLVDRLEEEGLMKRCAGEDRRCVKLQATDAGREATGALEEATLSIDEDAARCLTEAELAELKRLLERLQEGLAQVVAQPEGESQE